MANDIEHFQVFIFTGKSDNRLRISCPPPPTFELGSYWLLTTLLWIWALYQRHGSPVTALCFTLSSKEQTPLILMKSNLSDVTFMD